MGHVLRLALATFAILVLTALLPSPGWTQSAKIEVVPRIEHSTITSIGFSPDGRIIITGGERTIKLWEAKSGRLLRSLAAKAGDAPSRDPFRVEGQTEVRAVAYSPDGRTIASGHSDGILRFWEAVSGRELRSVRAHDTGYISAIAFSPDGRTLVSGSWDKTAKLWDVATGSLRRTLKGHEDYVESVAFSKDGRSIATTGRDGKVKLWDAASGRALRTIVAADRSAAGRCYDGDASTDEALFGIAQVAFSPEGAKSSRAAPVVH